MIASTPDLLRLLAVPVFAWAAYRDVHTRRVPNQTWPPLVGLAVVALVWDVWLILDADPYLRRLFVLQVVVSLALVAPLGYLFWRFGGFGGADAKAVMTLAVLFPAYPTLYLWFGTLPATRATLGVFSLTVLTNTVLLGLAYPGVLVIRNAVGGRFAPVMFIGRPVPARAATEESGRLLETPDGYTRSGLDLDALRMYLRWRDTSLASIRAHPERYRDPASLTDVRRDPGDGALPDGGGESWDGRPVGAAVTPPTDADRQPPPTDEWAAATFLAELDGGAYGTTARDLRAGLEVLIDDEEVWITPGIPFVVPMFLGLVVGLLYGDLLYGIMVAVGLV